MADQAGLKERARYHVRRWITGPGRRHLDSLLGPERADRLGLRKRRFERAAETGVWTHDGESISGSGSGMAATETIRAELPGLLRELGVRRMADIPCGDWNWMQTVDLPVDHYFGGDLVQAIVDQNTKRFGRPGVEFGLFDLCVDPLPDVDFLLCRDVLIHFSLADAQRVLARVRASGVEYFASTTFIDQDVNSDQATGIAWRHINLQRPPFDLPAPMRLIQDDYNRSDQRLGIWRVSDL